MGSKRSRGKIFKIAILGTLLAWLWKKKRGGEESVEGTWKEVATSDGSSKVEPL